ncbi:hypothetical protein [Natrinema sp. SYSU A 869]|uniref:hypothetical protein n=1 Tax=Natrinema sp. SYSU A 869 TaxID=2871694 RepID=UPI001CA3B7F3|nr:hypothetical protein [Natrinema sp. SYSU A 869]
MTGSLLILEEEFIIVLVIWLVVLLLAPLEWANGFWMGGALWLLGSAGAAIIGPGITSDTILMVTGQLFVWLLLSIIIFVRDYFEHGPGDDRSATARIIGILAFIGRLVATDPDQEQAPAAATPPATPTTVAARAAAPAEHPP